MTHSKFMTLRAPPKNTDLFSYWQAIEVNKVFYGLKMILRDILKETLRFSTL